MKKGKEGDHVILITDNPRRRSVRSLYFYFLICIGIALCFGSFIGWYHYKNTSGITITINDERIESIVLDSQVCSDVPDLERFDCHPEAEATEYSCLSRGCCFRPAAPAKKYSGLPPLNVPYCYYPSNYKGYALSGIYQDGKRIRAKLARVGSPSGFPNDVKNLRLDITFIDDNSLRIKITDPDSKRFEVPIPVNDRGTGLSAPHYAVSLDSKTGRLIIARKSSGTVIFQTELSQLVYADQLLQLSTRLATPHLFGIGEHYGAFKRSMNWTRLTLFNADLAPIPNHNLYGSHPFYLSMEPDGNANGVFLLNSNAMDVILQPTPALTFRPIGGIVDLFVMLGPSPANVVQQLSALTGRTPLPPYWSLGFHLCRYGYNSLNKTRESMQRNIDAGIPLDVQWNDIDYMERYKDFTYDKENFDGLPEFVDDLHKQGRHYVIMTDPGISNSEKAGSYPPYDEGLTDDVFIKNPNGSLFIGKVWTDGNLVFPDFSHPKADDWWKRQFEGFYKDVKYDGVWIDMNEPSNFNNGGPDGCETSSYEDPPYLPGGKDILRTKTVCMTAKHYNSIHYNEHNIYAYREAAATNKAITSVRGKRPFIISRASFSGQQVNSGHWSGDISSSWEDMRYTIPSMLNFNMYGMSMIGSDICGFNGNTTMELCARWQALGAFYPFSRNHNERDTIEQDPVALGPTVVSATKRALLIRYYFLPYLYTLFYRSYVFGDTVIRPLFFEFPHDEKSYAIDEQFMWGPAMMIIPPLYPNMSSVKAYMPEGVWYNNTGFPIEGNTFPAGLADNINLALRGGNIIPAQLPALETTSSRNNPFNVIVILDEEKKASGELYWDDGDSLETYERGAYNLITFQANKNVFSSTVTHKNYDSKMDVMSVQFVGMEGKPALVTVNGKNCANVPPPGKIAETSILMSPEKVFQDAPNGCFYVYVTASNGMYVGLQNSLLEPITVTWN